MIDNPFGVGAPRPESPSRRALARRRALFCDPFGAQGYNALMPRTFSLFRLMLGITAFCVICGLAVNVASFPEGPLVCVLVAGLCTPAIFIWLLMLGCSTRPVKLSIVSAIGCLVGLLIFSPILVSVFSPLDLADLSKNDETKVFDVASLGPALGVFLLGGALFLDEHRLRRGKP